MEAFLTYGLFGLVVLFLDIFAIIQVAGSGKPNATKLLWVLIIAVLPLVGVIAWFFAGPRSGPLAAR